MVIILMYGHEIFSSVSFLERGNKRLIMLAHALVINKNEYDSVFFRTYFNLFRVVVNFGKKNIYHPK